MEDAVNRSTYTICPAADCDRPIVRSGLCYGHYMKKWRYGSTNPQRKPSWEDVTGQRFGFLVAVERDHEGFWTCECDCGKRVQRRLGDLRRTIANACGDRIHQVAPVVGYTGAHNRVRKARGRASTHACVDCGRQAEHWSYDHADPNEMTTIDRGMAFEYSLDVTHYEPRCVSCHKAFDLAHIATKSPAADMAAGHKGAKAP